MTDRFNRYIVECKSIMGGVTGGGAGDLIDTQWNVNESIDINYMEWCLDLIDTQWNVNSGTLL